MVLVESLETASVSMMCIWDAWKGQVINKDKQVPHGKGLACEGDPCRLGIPILHNWTVRAP